MSDLHLYWEDLRPYVVGGASAGLFVYLISSIVQMIAIYKVCGKMKMGMSKKILLTAAVILPFGTGISLVAIAYDKERLDREKANGEEDKRKE